MGMLDGKVALITGGSRGQGRAHAVTCAREGAEVIIVDIAEQLATVPYPMARPDDLDETVKLIEAYDRRALAIKADVRSQQQLDQAVARGIAEFGKIDILIANAGIWTQAPFWELTDDQWDAILDVHLKAPFRILRAAQPIISGFVKRAVASGEPVPCRKVVNISSIAGLGGNAGQANYAAAKAGITGLTKTLAKEWGRYNVTVNTVAFGLIKTRLTQSPADGNATIDVQGREIKVGVNPQLLAAMEQMIPLGRAGTPAEAAGAVYLLCIPESDYVSAQTLICGGGFFI